MAGKSGLGDDHARYKHAKYYYVSKNGSSGYASNDEELELMRDLYEPQGKMLVFKRMKLKPTPRKDFMERFREMYGKSGDESGEV